MNTIGLSGLNDLYVDKFNNIALHRDAAAIAQDVASAIKLFSGEQWYDQTVGVPYFDEVLGQPYAEALLTGLINDAALTVPLVVFAQSTIHDITLRKVTGTCKVIDTTGQAHNVHF